MLLTISHTGKCTQEQMRSLEHLLKQRATSVEHYLKKNKTRVYLPGEKVDISAEVQKLLEQYKLPEKLQQELDVLYAMSNQAKTKKLRQSGRNYRLLYASEEDVTNILQSIQLKGGDHKLLNALRSHLKFRKEYADALLKERSKPQQRSKQSAENMPEVRKLLEWEGETLKPQVRYYGKTYSAECRIDGLDLVITMYTDPLDAGCEREQHFVLLMDSNGIKFPLEFPVENGTPYGYNQKTTGIKVTSEEEGKETIRIPLSKLDFSRELFAGFHRSWYDASGKQHNDPIPQGDHLYDTRLNFCASFSAGRLGKLILDQE